ncbi:MAG: nucleotidyltransferase family protein [Pseudomonadota bacterium]
MNQAGRGILLCSTILEPDEARPGRLKRLLSREPDLTGMVSMAAREGVAPLVYRNLKKTGAIDALSVRQQKALETLYYQTAKFNLRLIHDVKKVLKKAEEGGIRVILLQGISLIHQVYGNVALRPMTDIDLWVEKGHRAPFIGILKGAGFREDACYPDVFKMGKSVIDLHTHFLGGDRIHARRWVLGGGEDRWDHRAVPVDIEGQGALCLSPPDQVLYLSLHALKHAVTRLIWLVDILGILSGFNRNQWETLIRTSRDLGQEKALCSMLYLLHHLFDFRLPSGYLAARDGWRLGFFEKKALRHRIDHQSLPFWGPLLLFSPQRGLFKRLLYISETLIPRRAVLKQIFREFPLLKPWQLVLMRIVQLFGRIRVSLRGE